MKYNNFKAGFVSFGEVNTPKNVIEKKTVAALEEINNLDFDIISSSPVYDDEQYNTAKSSINHLKNENIDMLIVCIAGWIPTHAVIKVIDNFKNIPMVLWSLCGWEEDGVLISTADQAGATALNLVMKQMEYKYIYVFDTSDGLSAVGEIEAFMKAAYAKKKLHDCRIGSMGYRDMLLYGTTFEPISLRKTLGIEVEVFEMLEIVNDAKQEDAGEIKELIDYCMENWIFESGTDIRIIEKAVKYFLALKNKALKRDYKAMTLNDVDGMKKLENFPPATVLMLISDLLNICTTPENDVIGNATQLIVKNLTGQAAHYMEFYEFFKNGVLVGVPDYIPSSVVKGEVKMLCSKFGKLSSSISNVSSVKDGKVTLVRLIYTQNGYKIHAVTGEAVQPRKWVECGWSKPYPYLPSLEIRLDCSMTEFANKVSSQHTVIAYGDIMNEIKKFCYLTDIEIY